MGMFSKPSRKKQAPSVVPTPLSEKQRALQEQEAKVRAEVERCKKLVANAPRIAEEQRRRQREEVIARAAATHRPTRLTALQDPRDSMRLNNVAATGKKLGLRRERRQGRLMFFALLLTLAAAVFYLYHTVTHG